MIEFEIKNKQKVIIKKDGKEIGHIFTPGGTGKVNLNTIQICGFSEAFDFWGCGPYQGFKDIQLLFDNKKPEGEFSVSFGHSCLRCFWKPCQCEVRIQTKTINPFIVKTSYLLQDRIKRKK